MRCRVRNVVADMIWLLPILFAAVSGLLASGVAVSLHGLRPSDANRIGALVAAVLLAIIATARALGG